MIDVILMVVIAVIIGLGIWYIFRSKKKGVKCIGCPEGAKCTGNCAGCGAHLNYPQNGEQSDEP